MRRGVALLGAGIVTVALAIHLRAGEYFIVRNVGTVDAAKSEELLGKRLYELVKGNPGYVVWIVQAKCVPKQGPPDFVKCFYDSSKRVLAVMKRTAMPVGSDIYTWRVWYDVYPKHFRDGLPYYNEKLRTKGSPWRNPKASFPLKYPKHAQITEWP